MEIFFDIVECVLLRWEDAHSTMDIYICVHMYMYVYYLYIIYMYIHV